MQWEALTLLLIGITVNQLKSIPEGTNAFGLPVATGAYLYTLIFVSTDYNSNHKQLDPV
jgi:hypothetical protein